MEGICPSSSSSSRNPSNSSWRSTHQRTIIHLDMDCFYAQVEEVRDPTLRSRPLGVQQKNFVVTCNYKAREYGVQKLMVVAEAKRLCPELVLVNGEDLTPYRQMSQKIFEILLNYTPLVEKLGFDENFLDVTSLVAEEQKKQEQSAKPPVVIGHVYPPSADGFSSSFSSSISGQRQRMMMSKEKETKKVEEKEEEDENAEELMEEDEVSSDVLVACDCGCRLRLTVGSKIAQEIRDELLLKLGLTCSAGIAHNKLLAKLIGGRHKPNQQTTLLHPEAASQFLRELADLKRITGIGQRTESVLLESGITNIGQLQDCSLEVLRKRLGHDTAQKVKDLVLGNDLSAVRTSGKPKTISLEDSCKPLSLRKDVEERFRLLLMRLMEQVGEDGRIPICIKVIIRKYDPVKKCSHRETRQANILPSLFRTVVPSGGGGSGSGGSSGSEVVFVTTPPSPALFGEVIKVMLADGAQEKLLNTIWRLFERIVDLNKSFNITLIGLAFSKFQQRKMGSASIANFLIKKNDLEVQSVTSLTNFEIKDQREEEAAAAKETSSSSSTSAVDSPLLSTITSGQGDGKLLLEEVFRSSPVTFQPSELFNRRRCSVTASPIPMSVDKDSDTPATTTNSDVSECSSEAEVEPSPKKSRIGGHLMLNIAANRNNKRRRALSKSHLASNESLTDMVSPSKLRVCDLRLNSRDSDRDFPVVRPMAAVPTTSSNSNSNSSANPMMVTTSMDAVSSEDTTTSDKVRRNNGRRRTSMNTTATSPVCSDSRRWESLTSHCGSTNELNDNSSSTRISHQNEEIDGKVTMMDDGSILYPSNVDMQIFKTLPVDVQDELLMGWQRSLATAITNGNHHHHHHFTKSATTSSSSSGSLTMMMMSSSGDDTDGNGTDENGNNGLSTSSSRTMATAFGENRKKDTHRNQKNTLYRYFLRNK